MRLPTINHLNVVSHSNDFDVLVVGLDLLVEKGDLGDDCRLLDTGLDALRDLQLDGSLHLVDLGGQLGVRRHFRRHERSLAATERLEEIKSLIKEVTGSLKTLLRKIGGVCRLDC